MTLQEIMQDLEQHGSEQTRKTFARHGAPANIFGVKVEHLKTIVKKVKKNHELSQQLYATGNSDAMYLAGLIADEKKITRKQLDNWVGEASWYMISEHTVAGVAAESPFALEAGLTWIDSPIEKVATAGWCTLANYLSITPDSELDVALFDKLLVRIEKTIHQSPNRVRHTMNGFIISVGIFMSPLMDRAKKVAMAIGKVNVNMGDTACKVPLAVEYILKAESSGRTGKKRKMARC